MKLSIAIIALALTAGCGGDVTVKEAIHANGMAQQAVEAAKEASKNSEARTCVGGIGDDYWWVSCQ